MKARTNKQKVLEGGLKSALLAAPAKPIGFLWFCSLCLTFIQTVGQVTVLAAQTVQDFDQSGTPFTLTSVYGVPPSFEAGGPTGNFLRLAKQDYDTANNIAFDLTAPGTYSQVVAEFDFRMTPTWFSRADGFSFALLNTCVSSSSGSGPHLWEDPTVAGSFGVGFDIYQNTDDAIADSYWDWSATGDQGANGWTYGYYDRSLDAAATYGAEDFVPFPHDGNGYSPTDFWTGDGWDWFDGNPPWDLIFPGSVHPTSSSDPVDPGNHATHEHWVIHRWTSTVDGNLTVQFRFHKFDTTGGDGVTGLIFHNGVQIYSQSIAFNDDIGRDDTVDVPGVLMGDTLDFVLSPGADAGWDSTGLSATVFGGSPNDPNNNHISLHFNGAQKAVFPIDMGAFDLADGQFHRARVTLDFASGGAAVSVSLDGSFTPVANHFIAGLTPYESRVAFGARTGGEFAHHDLDNIRVHFNGPLPPVPPGLLGYWRFDEGAGTTALDSSGQGNDAPIYGASWGASYFGPVLCFDGLDDYVDISNLPDLWCQGTIEAWAMGGPEQEIVSGILADDFAVSGGEFAVYVGEWLSSGVALEPHAWYHFAATFDGTTWKVYVNGVLRNSLATSYVFNHPNKFIGQYFGYGPWNLNGCLAEVRIHSKALSEDEVLSNFKAGRPLVSVPVDIHPGSCPNPLNTRSVGTLPVAIVGLTGFDVAAVDVSTVKLAGVSPRHFALGDVSAPFSPFLGKQDCLSDCRTSGPDGIGDLMLHFDNQEVVAALGEVADGQCLVLPLTGYLTDGRPIIGEDVVLILKKR